MTDDEQKKLSERVRKAAKEGRVTMAPKEKLELVSHIADIIVEDCLGYTSFMITDLSSVYDFVDQSDIKAVIKKAKRIFDVDITSEIGEPIVDIAAYIIEQSNKEKK